MPGIAALTPCHYDAQGFIGTAVPIARATGRRANLNRHSSDGSDTAGRDVVRPDSPPADLAPHESTGQAVDVVRIDDIGLDAGRVEFGRVDTPRSNTVGTEHPRPDTACVDGDGIDLRRSQCTGIDTVGIDGCGVPFR